jgi:nicotinate phosphoribosyltransferase
LSGVRLDTPGSRRGDFERIIREVRWELDLRGHRHVEILVSGGLDEESVRRLAPVVDGFGVGTALSSGRTVDFAMDIAEVEGVPLAKRGKTSGAKEVFGCGRCLATVVVPLGKQPETPCPCGGAWYRRTVELPVGPGVAERRETVNEVRARTARELKLLAEAPQVP